MLWEGGDTSAWMWPVYSEEMGATEWERNWWRDMKTQQEALNKKAAIEQARGDSASD